MKQQNSQMHTCVLDAGGFQARLAIHGAPASTDHVDVVIEMNFPPEVGLPSWKSVPTFIAVRDLQRLGAYLEEHIAGLQEEPERESQIYAPLELGFQIQGLTGEVDPDGTGEFTLRVLAYVGNSPADGSRVYAGVESVVDVCKVKEFTVQLGECVSELVCN